MSLRPDLNPADLYRGEKRERNPKADLMLLLLEAEPLCTTEWQNRSSERGISRATFFRIKSQLESSGEVLHNAAANRWHLPNLASQPGQVESGETSETSETDETPPPNA
jgi:hypothetical protein